MLNYEGETESIMPLEPLEDKWKSFGWSVKTVDGHNISELYTTLSSLPLEKNNLPVSSLNLLKEKEFPVWKETGNIIMLK